jgi:hypothetical protein
MLPITHCTNKVIIIIGFPGIFITLSKPSINSIFERNRIIERKCYDVDMALHKKCSNQIAS